MKVVRMNQNIELKDSEKLHKAERKLKCELKYETGALHPDIFSLLNPLVFLRDVNKSFVYGRGYM